MDITTQKEAVNQNVDQDAGREVGRTSIHVRGTDADADPEENCEVVNNLRRAHTLCVKKILQDSSGRFDYIASKYGSILKDKTKDALKTEIQDILSSVQTAAKEEFENLLDQEQIASSVVDLQSIIKDFPSDKLTTDAWRPSGNPEHDIRPHIYQQKLELADKLNSQLAQEEEEFTALKNQIITKRIKLKDTCSEIQKLAKELDKDSELANNFLLHDADQITNTMMEISTGMR